MLLKARIAGMAGLLILPFMIGACTVRQDTASVRPGRQAGGRAAPLLRDEPTETPSPIAAPPASRVPAPAEKLAAQARPVRRFAGFRFDPYADPKRRARAERMIADPRTRPTPREQREARAMAQAQAALLMKGQAIAYAGDGSANDPARVTFVASRGALTIDVNAVERLNLAEGSPHALDLVIYHLSSRTAFDKLAAAEDGIRKLLQAEDFDPSVRSVERHTFQPGESSRIILHRPADGRHVALVAGYARPDGRTSAHVADYGIGRYLTAGESIVHNKKYMFAPTPLHLAVVLDETGMWVNNTGLIYENMRGVTSLTWQQRRHFLLETTWQPGFSTVGSPLGQGGGQTYP